MCVFDDISRNLSRVIEKKILNLKIGKVGHNTSSSSFSSALHLLLLLPVPAHLFTFPSSPTHCLSSSPLWFPPLSFCFLLSPPLLSSYFFPSLSSLPLCVSSSLLSPFSRPSLSPLLFPLLFLLSSSLSFPPFTSFFLSCVLLSSFFFFYPFIAPLLFSPLISSSPVLFPPLSSCFLLSFPFSCDDKPPGSGHAHVCLVTSKLHVTGLCSDEAEAT